MKCREHGVMEKSEFFFHTPTNIAKSLFFYVEICGHFYSNDNYSIERKTFNSFMIIYVLDGSLHVKTPDFDSVVTAGRAVLIDCYRWHYYKTQVYCEFVYIHFNGSNSRDFYKYITQQRGSVFPIDEKSSVPNYFHIILSHSRNEKKAPEKLFSQILYSLLTDISSITQEEARLGEKNQFIEKAVRYIHENISRQISLDDIAAHVGVSTYYFARIFKQAIGISPHEYIILLRIDNAKYLLRMTNDTVVQIAFQVGYSSENHFISSFTSRVGISPGKFRRLFPG